MAGEDYGYTALQAFWCFVAWYIGLMALAYLAVLVVEWFRQRDRRKKP